MPTHLPLALLVALVPAVTLADSPTRAETEQPPPNIVLIMADDLGAECLSCYGGLEVETPRLDALAAAGARFTQAHSQPLCTPTRVQIMTGQYNFRNYDEFGYLDPNETTFADLFREAGYRTAVAGKWQLSGQARSYPEQTDPDDWGFDEFCLWQLNNRKPYGDIGPRFWNPYLEQNGKVIRPGEDAYGPDVCTDFLIDFITANRDRPFLAYYPMILTHSPFLPTPSSDPDRPRDKKDVRNFRDMVAYTDLLVGRIVDHLETLDLADSTIVIFAGDNGTSGKVTTRTRSGPVRGGKGKTTISGTHVPLIVSWPGTINAAAVDDRLIDFTDVFPSLLAAARIEPPASLTLDGTPFLAADGLSEEKREAIYCWYRPRHSKRMSRRNATFAQNADYKLFADGQFLRIKNGKAEELGETPPQGAQAAKQSLQKVLDRYAAQGDD